MKKHLYSKIPLSQRMVALCRSKGIRHIVISPGSRNAPLIIGFSEHPDMQCYSIVDERCAAFFGLGMAQQLQQPVVLVCTSGSALLNYYPAIAEAFYSDIPLVVLSADRPIAYIDIGDGQTIRQRNVFENHIVYAADLYLEMVPDKLFENDTTRQHQEQAALYNEQEINVALNTAIADRGPVHINVPFDEPLYDKITSPTVFPKDIPVAPIQYPVYEVLRGKLSSAWNQATRKMILIGVCNPETINQQWIASLAEDPSVLVLTETTSNIHHATHINCIDQLITSLTHDEFTMLQPDILLTFGGMVVSKRIKSFLRKYQPKLHWHVHENKKYDTYFCLTEYIKMKPNSFLDHFIPDTVPLESTYKAFWVTMRNQRRQKHAGYLKALPFTDLKVFEILFKLIPDHQLIQLSNSSTIRYAQLFSLNPTCKVFCNRGTSGIDGSTSTAIGAAVASGVPTTLITGDLSFFYDSNGLWNAHIPSNFKIILVNNQGGGIFRVLPDTGKEDSTTYSTYFETKHALDARPLCEMFGIGYSVAKSAHEVITNVQDLYANHSFPQLLEVFTPRKENDGALIDYFKHFV